MKLDAHQHFWKYSPEEYPWIPAGTVLQRDALPDDLEALQQPLGFDGSIAVQARQSLEESRWLLELAQSNPRIRGVVGWVDLRDESVGEVLAELSQNPRFVGVRHVVQDEPDDRFLVRPDFVRGVRNLARHGLSYDLLIYPHQLPAAIELVRLLPNQRFVLDHLAKPRVKTGEISPWNRQIRELASCPNVWCKVSGLVTEAHWTEWKPADFKPYLDLVLEAFGPSRLMFGSDWPVCQLAATYAQVQDLAAASWEGLSLPDQQALWGGTCAEFYRINGSSGSLRRDEEPG
jgi:L-fuconolactonase